MLKSLEEEYSPVVNSNLLNGPVAHDDTGILCPTGKSVGMKVLGSVEGEKKKGEMSVWFTLHHYFASIVTARTKKLDIVYV